MSRPALVALALGSALALGAPGAALADSGERIRAEIQSGLPADLVAVEVRVPRQLEDAGGPVAIDWRRPARPGWLTVRATVGDKSGWVRARVAAMTPTVVAVRALPIGHVIGPDDVRLEQRPSERPGSGAAALPAVEAAVGRAVRAAIMANAPVPPGALERAAPLPRGHNVRAVVRRGGLSISTAAVLERPAAIGQLTTVRLRSTGRVVPGRLIDSATVLLEVTQ